MLRAISRHSPQLAQAVVDVGALTSLCQCLEEFDPGVKEAAAWALGYIARHNAGNNEMKDNSGSGSTHTTANCG